MKTSYMLVLGLLCFTVGTMAMQVSESASRERPWFCHGIDCPKYKLVDSTDEYEVREYESSVWASTVIESYAYALAVPQGFQRLFQYIDGANKDNIKIPMTAPVRVRVNPSSGPFCKSNFTISFFVPFHFQDDIPEPDSEDIFIEEIPPFTAYVAQSGGFKFDDFSLAKMAENLADALNDDGIEYETDFYYFAGYDPPFRVTGRHNEVWFVEPQDDDDNKNVLLSGMKKTFDEFIHVS